MPHELDAGLDRIEASTPFWLEQPRHEPGMVVESLNELRNIPRDLDKRGWEEGPLPQDESDIPPEDVRMTGKPGRAEPVRRAPGGVSGGAIAIFEPVPAAPKSPAHRRTGMARLALAIAGLTVLGATGLGVVRSLAFPHSAAIASEPRQARLDDGSAAMARAVLPPLLVPAAAHGGAAPSAAAAPGQPAAIGHGAPAAAMLGGSATSAVFRPPKAAAPHMAAVPDRAAALRTASISPSASRTASAPGPARTALSLPPPAAPSAGDRSLGKSLREAGDMRIVEGDIASARLFYERAADIGDAQAAFDLGNSYNPIFLKRLGVLGMRGDVTAAARWYRRARALGNPDAATALQGLAR